MEFTGACEVYELRFSGLGFKVDDIHPKFTHNKECTILPIV